MKSSCTIQKIRIVCNHQALTLSFFFPFHISIKYNIYSSLTINPVQILLSQRVQTYRSIMPIVYFYVVCCYLVTIVQNMVCSCFNKLHLNNAITFSIFIILSGLHQNNRRDPICVTLHYQKQSPPPPLYQYVMRSKSDRPSTNMKSKPCRNILAHTILFIDK